MHQPANPKRAAVRLTAVALSLLLLLLLTGCSLFSGEKSTEWLVKGQYKPLYPAQNTTDKLMGCLRDGDLERLYQVLSPAAKNQQRDFQECLEELEDFFQAEVLSWEHGLGGNLSDGYISDGQVRRSRDWTIELETRDGAYECAAIDVIDDDFIPGNVGFYSLTVFPADLGLLCGNGAFYNGAVGSGEERAGIFLSYREETPDDADMEQLMALAAAGDGDGIFQLFSPYAQEHAEDLPGQIETLMTVLDRPILSQELYGCVTEREYLPGMEEPVVKRHTMYVLETDGKTYVLHLRDLLEPESRESLGLYSVTFHAEEHSIDYKNLGWQTPGVFVKQLTVDAELEGIENGFATVTLSTSVEAEVTCDRDTVTPKQLDALTWEVTIPMEWEYYIFTAATETESVEQPVTVNSDGNVLLYSKYELD